MYPKLQSERDVGSIIALNNSNEISIILQWHCISHSFKNLVSINSCGLRFQWIESGYCQYYILRFKNSRYLKFISPCYLSII